MDIMMRVHTLANNPVEVDVVFNGEHARAKINEFEVELMCAEGKHGTLALRFRAQSDIAAARALFTQGGVVKMSIGPASVSTEADPGHKPTP
jgi:hypothetical protein